MSAWTMQKDSGVRSSGFRVSGSWFRDHGATLITHSSDSSQKEGCLRTTKPSVGPEAIEEPEKKAEIRTLNLFEGHRDLDLG